MPTPTPAVLELAGPAPSMPIGVQPAALQITGPAPTLAAGLNAVVQPAPAILAITGPAPRQLVYTNASLTATRVTARPAFTGRLRAYRHA